MLLQNKTAVITGCNRGIGKKILEVFSANGATIFACVRNVTEEFKNSLNEIKNEISMNAQSRKMNLVQNNLMPAAEKAFFDSSGDPAGQAVVIAYLEKSLEDVNDTLGMAPISKSEIQGLVDTLKVTAAPAVTTENKAHSDLSILFGNWRKFTS